MYKAIFVCKLAILAVCFAGGASEEPDSNLFIAVVKRGVDVHVVAKDIKRHNDDPDHPWVGSVKKTHPHIGVLLVHGSDDTCSLLTNIRGIKQCEKDSLVSLAD